jgi:hypothetical protein
MVDSRRKVLGKLRNTVLSIDHCSNFAAENSSKDRKYRKEWKEQNDSFDLILIG